MNWRSGESSLAPNLDIPTKIGKKWLNWGAGPRASSMLVMAAKAYALINGRTTPEIEDVKEIKSLNNANIEGIIIGKAIYDGDIKISDLAKLI